MLAFLANPTLSSFVLVIITFIVPFTSWGISGGAGTAAVYPPRPISGGRSWRSRTAGASNGARLAPFSGYVNSGDGSAASVPDPELHIRGRASSPRGSGEKRYCLQAALAAGARGSGGQGQLRCSRSRSSRWALWDRRRGLSGSDRRFARQRLRAGGVPGTRSSPRTDTGCAGSRTWLASRDCWRLLHRRRAPGHPPEATPGGSRSRARSGRGKAGARYRAPRKALVPTTRSPRSAWACSARGRWSRPPASTLAES
jgi:hypothetical protein